MSFEEVNKYLGEIEKSIQSFQKILEDHRQYHWELMADYQVIPFILNDIVNKTVKTVEVTTISKEGVALVEQVPHWCAYRQEQLNRIQQSFIEHQNRIQSQQEANHQSNQNVVEEKQEN